MRNFNTVLFIGILFLVSFNLYANKDYTYPACKEQVDCKNCTSEKDSSALDDLEKTFNELPKGKVFYLGFIEKLYNEYLNTGLENQEKLEEGRECYVEKKKSKYCKDLNKLIDKLDDKDDLLDQMRYHFALTKDINGFYESNNGQYINSTPTEISQFNLGRKKLKLDAAEFERVKRTRRFESKMVDLLWENHVDTMEENFKDDSDFSKKQKMKIVKKSEANFKKAKLQEMRDEHYQEYLELLSQATILRYLTKEDLDSATPSREKKIAEAFDTNIKANLKQLREYLYAYKNIKSKQPETIFALTIENYDMSILLSSEGIVNRVLTAHPEFCDTATILNKKFQKSSTFNKSFRIASSVTLGVGSAIFGGVVGGVVGTSIATAGVSTANLPLVVRSWLDYSFINAQLHSSPGTLLQGESLNQYQLLDEKIKEFASDTVLAIADVGVAVSIISRSGLLKTIKFKNPPKYRAIGSELLQESGERARYHSSLVVEFMEGSKKRVAVVMGTPNQRHSDLYKHVSKVIESKYGVKSPKIIIHGEVATRNGKIVAWGEKAGISQDSTFIDLISKDVGVHHVDDLMKQFDGFRQVVPKKPKLVPYDAATDQNLHPALKNLSQFRHTMNNKVAGIGGYRQLLKRKNADKFTEEGFLTLANGDKKTVKKIELYKMAAAEALDILKSVKQTPFKELTRVSKVTGRPTPFVEPVKVDKLEGILVRAKKGEFITDDEVKFMNEVFEGTPLHPPRHQILIFEN